MYRRAKLNIQSASIHYTIQYNIQRYNKITTFPALVYSVAVALIYIVVRSGIQLRPDILQGSAGVLQKPVPRPFGVYEADRRR